MRAGWILVVLALSACGPAARPGPETELEVELDPGLAEAVPTALVIAGALTESGDHAAALAYYRFAYERDRENEVLAEKFVTSALINGRAQEAADVLDGMIQQRPERWEWVAQRARLALVLTEPELAEELSASLLPNHGHRPPVVDLRADFLVGAGRLAEATQVLETYLAETPADAERAFRRATLLLRQDNRAEAEVQLRSILAQEADHPEAIELLGALLRDGKRHDDWRALVAQLLAEKPESRLLNLEMADIEIARGQATDAASRLVPLARQGELDWSDRLLLADLLNQIDRRPEALELVEQLLAEGWEGPLVLRLAGSLHMEEGDDAKAEEYLRRALDVDPQDVDAMLTLVLVVTRQTPDLFAEDGLNRAAYPKKSTLVRSLIDRAAAAADPDKVRHQYLVGAFLRRSGQTVVSLPFLERAAELDPDNEQILYDLAVSQEQSKEYEQAVQTLEALVELQPDDAHYLNFFGYLLADQGWQLERAEEMVRRALEQDPDNAFYLDSMGWVCFRTERFEEALDYLVSASNSLGDDPVVLEHMGDTLAALGRYEQALRVYRMAQAAGGDDARLVPRVDEVERLLRRGP